ncbi:hypothetical protein [Variovorax sp. Sphag1AA]|uniref:hypothetical protein n=1 Tax=Variovorax sp. Sphag1AA TaxID=2587027 RepID=UPI001610F702|nr:hypothetical protein [Variovorax sp. Sphag1AA]MBB3181213.1 hypothetical protein [Variovorax sp. Sphag1AA]
MRLGAVPSQNFALEQERSRILKRLALWTTAHVGLLFVWLGLFFKYQQLSLETSELLIWSAATVFVWVRLVLLIMSWRAVNKEPMLDR